MQETEISPSLYIDRAEFLKLADLAELSFSEEEANEMLTDLDKTIALFAELSGVETDGVGKSAALTLSKLRDDVVVEGMPREALLNNAPVKTEEYLLVPRVVE